MRGVHQSGAGSLRREKGWSQQQLADVLNNTPQWVSLVETGKQNLRIHTLVRLARALKVPVPSLLDPPEVPPPAKTRGRPRKDQ
ncbi:MAG: helix-turn-helix transcriptional regulator [Myxococcales bacterium]|nr:helix-turn-helix transcriptional regulator [Myxococcales bacterium]